MTREEAAVMRHDRKYNCAQAVACSFAEDLGADEKVLFRACEGFGLGMGCTEATCGALSGAVMCAGMKNSDANLETPGTKAETYQIAKAMVLSFKDQVGAVTCREIKGIDTGEILCSCENCIRIGVRIAENALKL